MPNIVALAEMPWRGEAELAAELDDGDVVLVDRWYTDERNAACGSVHVPVADRDRHRSAPGSRPPAGCELDPFLGVGSAGR